VRHVGSYCTVICNVMFVSRVLKLLLKSMDESYLPSGMFIPNAEWKQAA